MLGSIWSGDKVADVCMLMLLSCMCYVMLTLMSEDHERSQPGSKRLGDRQQQLGLRVIPRVIYSLFSSKWQRLLRSQTIAWLTGGKDRTQNTNMETENGLLLAQRQQEGGRNMQIWCTS